MNRSIPQLTPARRAFIILLLSVGAFLALNLHSAQTSPTGVNVVVNTTTDESDISAGDAVCDTNGAVAGPQCTLRAAIQEANAFAGDDTVNFEPGLSGVIALSTALPNITSNMTIVGPGADVLTVQRSTDVSTPNFRLLTILAGMDVSISGLTLTNGSTDMNGGAILNQGSLTITDSVIKNNAAASGTAVFSESGSELNVTRTTVSDNTTVVDGTGPAILTHGSFNLIDSTVSNNPSGAIAILGDSFTAIRNSTISNNSSNGPGGVLINTSDGAFIGNTTITGNRADHLGSSGATGGGIHLVNNAGFIVLTNTIVAGNFRGVGTTPDDISGSGSLGSDSEFNLIGVGGSAGLVDGMENNKVGVAHPRLGPLADNGGPTQTHRLLPGSPALDAGNNCVLTDNCFPDIGLFLSNDQRGAGFPRAANGDLDEVAKVDIGAYEAQEVLISPPLVVTNTNDSGAGSFRQALLDASVSGNLIRFEEGLTGTISLQTPLPDLTVAIHIEGPGPNRITVQRSSAGGTPSFRIFNVTSGATVRISGLTIANGMANGATEETGSGGGIRNDGTLFVDGCVVTGNHAGFGGGISTRRFLRITNSTISNNTSSDDGGGIGYLPVAGQRLEIDRSTISNNVSNDEGGGIFSAQGRLVLTNTTISANSAAHGGGIRNRSPAFLRDVTITANTASVRGGGIRNDISDLEFSNSIIAGNTSPLGPDLEGLRLISADYNVIGNTTGFPLQGRATHNFHNVNPRLGPLADNGGPTRTHALLDGSPAIDTGSSTFTTDQRGLPRRADHANVANAVGGDASDIGAFESRPFEVNSLADADDGACTLPGAGNGCTLREAMNAANTIPGTQTITFAPSLTAAGPAVINLLSGLPFISSDMNIIGSGADLLTVQRSNAAGTPDFRIFSVGNSRTVTISDLTVANSKLRGSGNGGGGVLNQGTLTLENCNFYGNETDDGGGAIRNEGVSLIIRNCNIGGTGPGQPNTGRGIINVSGNVSMIGGSIVGNFGGGIMTGGTSTSLDGVSITDNKGNGVFASGTTRIANCLIANNHAFEGGGIKNLGTTTVMNTTISGNTTFATGAGIHNFNAFLTLINVTVTKNRADTDADTDSDNNDNKAGGVDASSGGVRLDNTIVAGNTRGTSQSPVADDLVSLTGINVTGLANVIGVCQNCGLTNGELGNQVGVADAGLGPLADNGGPTLTHALLPASPALDRGNNVTVVNPPFIELGLRDQRGFSRVVDGPDADLFAAVDVGAFEQQPPVSEIQNRVIDEDTGIEIAFDVGDRGSITSITVSSANETLLPNDSSHLRLIDAGSTEIIRINPAANRSGTTDITVTVHRTGGDESRTFNLLVFPVNDAPTFLRGLNRDHDEDHPTTLIFWATNISPGPPDESSQTVSFQITGNTNPGLFAQGPAIDSSGMLGYLLTPNASGTAVITVVLKDNGGTAIGGQDTSAPQTFAFTISPVNDAPVNTVPSSPSMIENGTLTFSNSNAISVADVDAGGAEIQVTLSAPTGLLTLASTSGLSFVSGGNISSLMTFRGTIASINAALNGLKFAPNNGVSGLTTVRITTNDLGNTGAGSAAVDEDTILITVFDGGSLQFTTSAFAVSEDGASNPVIAVSRLFGFSGATSVNFATSNGTATGGAACGPGVDYVSTSGTLPFANGDTVQKSFTIVVCPDADNEEHETVNITLSTVTGSGSLGLPSTATLTLMNDDAPLLLMEPNSQQAIALDSVFTTRDPFSLLNVFNLSSDGRRRVSLFVERLGLLPTDNASNLTVIAEDDLGVTYPLTVEHVGPVAEVAGVSQIVVLLPANVFGAPRDLWVTVKLRGPASNRAFIKIAAP